MHKNEWKEELKKNTTTSSGPMDKWMVKKATPKPSVYAKNVYGRVDYMLNRNKSPSFCEDPTVRQYTNLDPINEDTLNKYLNKVAFCVYFRFD